MRLRETSVAVIGIALLTVIINQSVLAAADPSLVLYLPFDEGNGDKAADLSGNKNNGTLQGAKWVAGKYGKALSFDGTNFVTIPHNVILEPDKDITVMAWVNIAKDASGELAIVSKGKWAANDLPYELTVEAAGVIFWQFYDNAGRDTCQAPPPPAGEWHHIAGTYEGKAFRLYVDGELKNEWAYAGKLPKNGADVTIGKRSKANETFFKGSIDEVGIFSRALPLDEIKAKMQLVAPAAVTTSGKLPVFWADLKQ